MRPTSKYEINEKTFNSELRLMTSSLVLLIILKIILNLLKMPRLYAIYFSLAYKLKSLHMLVTSHV